jgi:hypothetical protein
MSQANRGSRPGAAYRCQPVPRRFSQIVFSDQVEVFHGVTLFLEFVNRYLDPLT